MNELASFFFCKWLRSSDHWWRITALGKCRNIGCTYIPISEHCGGVVFGTSWPYRQVALLPPLLTRSAGQVRVISTPCSTGRLESVTTLLHVESRFLQSDSEIIICTLLDVTVKLKLCSIYYLSNIWWKISIVFMTFLVKYLTTIHKISYYYTLW